VEAGYAVRIDAAKVGRRENVGGLDGVVFGDAEVKEDASAEFAKRIDVKDFGLDGGHVWPFFGKRWCANATILENLRSRF